MSFGFGLGFPKGALAAGLQPALNLQFAGSQVLDPRITFTRASNATRFNQSGVLETVGNNVARFDYDPSTLAPLGLLIEEQRTNSIRNNTMQGAVAGTPGTIPSNWSVFAAGGLTTTVVGTGTSNGITYIDLRFSGTSTSTVYVLAFDNSAVAASAGQSWTESFWVSTIGGSTNNIDSLNFNIRWSSGNAEIPFTSTATFTRLSATAVAPAAITNVIPALFIRMVNGAAIDITLRIGLPQLELGAFATSVIPTTTAAATRAADNASMTGTNFSSWYNATEGALFAEWSPLANQQNREFVAISDGTYNNYYSLGNVTAGNVVGQMGAGGVSQLYQSAGTSLSLNKGAIAYAANSKTYVLNGAVMQSNTTAAVPTGVTQMGLGVQSNNSTNRPCVWLRRIAYFNTRLANANLQALTS